MNNIEQLFDIFEEHDHELYLVGGPVRDFLRGELVSDYDFATSALPEQTMQVLRNAGYKPVPIGIEFGTVQVTVADYQVEITTYRCEESYTKGSRKPGVRFGSTIHEDLQRRDFTFNAMAMDRDGNITDPHDGELDLQKGIIRTPADPLVSFRDDPLRMLRACRFLGRRFAGRFDGATRTAIYELRHLVNTLSAERIFEEMTKLLCSSRPDVALNEMEALGLLRHVAPELQAVRDFREDQGRYHHLPVWEHTLAVVCAVEPRAELRWAALYHDVCKPVTWSRKGSDVHFYGHDHRGADLWRTVARRLKTSRDFEDHVAQLIYEHQNVRASMGKRGVRRMIDRLGDRLDDLLELRRADIVGHKPSLMESSLSDLESLRRRIEQERAAGPVSPKLPRGTGDRIADELGVDRGPELGHIMRRLRSAVVDGELAPDADFVAAAKEMIDD